MRKNQLSNAVHAACKTIGQQWRIDQLLKQWAQNYTKPPYRVTLAEEDTSGTHE